MIIFVIILLGAVVRLYALGDHPSGFFRDEAALGYNAYSIWSTGRDEYGELLPTVFRSFEVFFLPLYVYITAPFVGLLGLSEFATRLPSALSGVFLLAIVYFIAKEIWGKTVALLALFILAISPWHIFYSRGAFEGNFALTLFSAGLLFWLKFIKRETKHSLFISAVFFILSMYSYQSERVLVPLFLLLNVLLFPQKFWKLRKIIILPAFVGLILLLPLLSLSLKAGGYHRALGVSIFSQKVPPGWIENEKEGFFVNNKIYLTGRQVAALYLSYFSPKNLFRQGDSDKQRSVENYSVFYAWMFPFMLLGFWSLIKKTNPTKKIILLCLLISPIPAALTADPFHTYRSLPLYFFLSLVVALGLNDTYKLLKRKNIFLIIVGFVAAVSTAGFLFSYFVVNPATRARHWDYGYKELMSYLNQIATLESNSSKIVVDDIWTEAYIHFLFFGKVDPKIYHREIANLEFYYTNPDEIRPNKLKNYEFREVDWPSERGNRGTIFAISQERLPKSEFEGDPKIELLKEIKYLNGETAFRIVRVK